MLLDTPICDFGWKAPDFELSDPDGVSHSLNKSMGQNGLLIAFICNHCPYVHAVIERLVADAKILQQEGFGVLAIMSNDYRNVPADSPAQMKLFARQHGFTSPIWWMKIRVSDAPMEQSAPPISLVLITRQNCNIVAALTMRA